MILNQNQYKITRKQLIKLETALKMSIKKKDKMDKRIFYAMLIGIESKIIELKNQIKHYEDSQKENS
jgi:hypothetical protein